MTSFDSKALNRRVWLVKLPKSLAEKWNTLPQNNVELGTLRFGDTKMDGSQDISLTLSNIPQHEGIPKEFSFENGSRKDINMHVLRLDDQGNPIGIQGVIDREIVLKPSRTQDVASILKRETLEAMKPKRKIVEVDVVKDKVGFVKPIAYTQDYLNKQLQEGKRDRLPKEHVLNQLFKAFEKHPYWALKDLVRTTNQPVTYIKELLNEICVINSRGPYKNLYQLRQDFTQRTSMDID
ncbi:Transcription initiation factor IIF, beta subunit domain-containing protein [Rozella allomycis CSF55]|uniref:Transcription initiation factor IIF subunit beta n=1 Tax=Rozella allomycis (strain CSF55) TaxID=988480 RepID=A0A075AQY6_ROZAC|nr:Transcription initiation factor IIF, beta subunit domain-containing protein [Rozella allomycis CSF55]|eukprot:EPZ32701.1 Transcription initiation factor IIF, beta subunit domain-containing protein [Rozella allomycis CSF55]